MIEGFSFFVEAIFIAIYVYGWDRLPRRTHFLAGIPMVIAGVTGRIVAPGDLDAMTNAVGVALADERFLADAGAAALSHVCEVFPLSREVEDLRAVYERVWSGG